MPRPRKIGVLTFHKCINYGSYWQARCLVEGLRAKGFDAELLDHHCSGVEQAELRCALQPHLPDRTAKRHLKHYSAKVRAFHSAFRRLPLSRRFDLHRPPDAGRYDAIVVGSDEVWNFRHPWYGSKPIFFGEDLPAERVLSYGASFGNHSAWDGIHPDWAAKLAGFSALSVRDENSVHLVRNGLGENPKLVLDPCLLFPHVAKAEANAHEEFAVVYGHGFPEWLQHSVRDWAERRGVTLVSIGYANEWADEQRIGAGPLEFARMMSAAQAVVTNFFHGCVFALLNGKPWIAAPSAYRAIKIPDLARLLGVEDRLITEVTPPEQLHELLGTGGQASLDDLRGRSEAYLDAALA